MPGIGNCGCETRDGSTQSRRMEVSTKQLQIAELAEARPKESFTSLNHYLDMDWMKEAYRGKTRKGGYAVKRKTGGKRMSRSLKAINQWLQSHLHLGMREQWDKLRQKLLGHFAYYG